MSEGTESEAFKRYLAAARARVNPQPIDDRTLTQIDVARQESKQMRILQKIGRGLLHQTDSWRAAYARRHQKSHRD